MSVDNFCSFQGYLGKAVSYRRSIGFTAEPGWIDMDFSEFKKLLIVARRTPWRNASGIACHAGTSIHAWKHAAASLVGITIPEEGLAALPAPSGGGFNDYGDLVMDTILDGEDLSPMVYKDVMVDVSGIEEISKNLDKIRDHNRGVVRVPLTDLRSRYARCSPLYTSVNMPLSFAKWHPDTVMQDKNGNSLKTPYPFFDVFEFLLSQLPGSPKLSSQAEVRDHKFDPPTSIEGIGQPAVEELEKLCERNGILPQYLPNGNYSATKRGSKRYSYGKMAIGVNQSKSTADDRYETKTQWVTGRPPLVSVKGGRRVRRRTTRYDAALKDLDEKYYHLPEIVRRYKWTMKALNRAVCIGGDRGFRDLPPQDNFEQKVEILKKAYQVFIPAHLFAIAEELAAQNSSAGVKAVASGEVGVGPDAFELDPFKPVKAPMYLRELNDLGVTIPFDSKPTKGDLEQFFLVDPIVRAGRMGQGFFPDWEMFLDQFNSQYVSPLDEQIKQLQLFVDRKLKQINEHAASMSRPHTMLEKAIIGSGATSLGYAKFASQLKLADVNADIKEIDEISGVDISSQYGLFETGSNRATLSFIKGLAKEIQSTRKEIAELKKAKEEQQQKLGDWGAVHSKWKQGIPCWVNLPIGVMPKGRARLNDDGVLESSELLALMVQPFVTNPEKAIIGTAGGVTVTHGYEIKENQPSDWTLLHFMAEDDEAGTPQISVVAGFRSTPIAGKIATMKARLYEADDGTPMNLLACTVQAFGKACEELDMPLVVDGFTYEFSGFRRAWLDGGVVSVQHTWDGRNARTHVSVNAPMAHAAPLGPAFAVPVQGKVTAEISENGPQGV